METFDERKLFPRQFKKCFKISIENYTNNLRERLKEIRKGDFAFLEIQQKLENKDNLKIADIFRELHYAGCKLLLLAPKTKFLRNLYEGYDPKEIQINSEKYLLVKNYE